MARSLQAVRERTDVWKHCATWVTLRHRPRLNGSSLHLPGWEHVGAMLSLWLEPKRCLGNDLGISAPSLLGGSAHKKPMAGSRPRPARSLERWPVGSSLRHVGGPHKHVMESASSRAATILSARARGAELCVESRRSRRGLRPRPTLDHDAAQKQHSPPETQFRPRITCSTRTHPGCTQRPPRQASASSAAVPRACP